MPVAVIAKYTEDDTIQWDLYKDVLVSEEPVEILAMCFVATVDKALDFPEIVYDAEGNKFWGDSWNESLSYFKEKKHESRT